MIGKEFSVDKYGIANNYSEIRSCSFDGLDKTYTYDHFEITTFPDGNKDKIYSIYFTDEEVSTTEGVSISDSLEDVFEKYGKEYSMKGNLYQFVKGGSAINFIVEDETVVSIEYVYNENK